MNKKLFLTIASLFLSAPATWAGTNLPMPGPARAGIDLEITRKLAREDKDVNAQRALGQIFLNQGNYSDAVEMLIAAARQKDAQSEYLLGTMYDDGRGVPADLSIAMKWYKSAAKHGSQEAAYALGDIYYQGRGDVPQDLKEAARYLTQASAE